MAQQLTRPYLRQILLLLMLFGVGAPTLLAREPAPAPQIALKGYRFDPLAGPPALPAALNAAPTSADPTLYLVQFDGPVEQPWKDAIAAAGAALYGYIPEHAFIARMDATTADSVARLPHVRWVGPYQPAFRLDPALSAPALAAEPIELPPLSVQTLPDADLDALAAAVTALGGSVESRAANELAGYLGVRLPAIALADLAAHADVVWVEPRAEVGKLNDVGGAGIIGVGQVRQRLGLYGAGQIIGIADTGLDVGDPARLHPDLRGRLVKAYCLGRPQPCDYSDYDGHGTHVAGSVLGSGVRSGSNPAAHQYDGSYAGTAPEARFVFQSTIDDQALWSGLPADTGDLMRQAYADGARIHTNSWGGPTGIENNQPTYGGYPVSSQQVDLAAWQRKDMLILFAAGNNGADTDGDGVVDPDSLLRPGTAKNALTIGASENRRPDIDAVWGQAYGNPIAGDRRADNIDGMAAFSSRGPTDDGRIKPDLAAPGTYVASVRSQQFMLNTRFEGDTAGYQTDVRIGGGTAAWQPTGTANSGAGAIEQKAVANYGAGAASMLLTPVFNGAAGGSFELRFFHRYRLAGNDDRLGLFFIAPSAQNPQELNQLSLTLNLTGSQTTYAPFSIIVPSSLFEQQGLDPRSLRIGFAIVSEDDQFNSEWAIDDLRVDGSQWASMADGGLAQPGDQIDESYHMMGGTSMATPLAAGGAALVREWLTRVKGLETPSAALMKALLINGAADMGAGQYGTGPQREIPSGPNSVSGWGRVDLIGALMPAAPRQIWFADNNTGVATGGTVSYKLVVGANGDIVAESAPTPASTPLALAGDAGCGLACLDSASARPNGLPSSAPALAEATQLLANPGFESADWGPWDTMGRPMLDATWRHSGARAALLGGLDNADDRIGQSVKIPAGATALSLSGWLSSRTAEVFFGSDSICIGLWEPNGNRVMEPLCADIAELGDNDWFQFSYSLSPAELKAAAGKQLVFGAVLSNDSSLPSTIWLDDLSLTVQAPAAATPTTATPRPTTPVPQPGAGGPLRLTLTWTDYPGQPMAARTLVNDLDLEVIGPDGTRYLGNAGVYQAGHNCLEQGRDRCNNVEGVRIPAARPGVYTVIVRGAQVAQGGAQPFALAGSGDHLRLEGSAAPPVQRLYLPLLRK